MMKKEKNELELLKELIVHNISCSLIMSSDITWKKIEKRIYDFANPFRIKHVRKLMSTPV
jgi:hypothetical protein